MPKRAQGKCVVFDVGKTFTKASVVDAQGRVWAQTRTPTPHIQTPLYRAFDVDRLYNWFIAQLRDFGNGYCIDRIIPVTHGATCAFLDENEQLVQPIQDYESVVPARYAQAYRRIRPDFNETQSPHLPRGLNLGCQIYWHAERDPVRFARVRWILSYPQYWVWRLSGALCNEVTSMGCHTDLWSPTKGGFSSLAIGHNWSERFPSLHPAWERVATLRSDVARMAHLPPSTRVCVGLHDSNAALASILVDPTTQSKAPALLSTGTWYIAMAPGAAPVPLASQRDCLANVDVFGKPVPCARFMGGRVYDMFSDSGSAGVDEASLRAVMSDRILAMPSFADAGGPFPSLRGEILGLNADCPQRRAALGHLYVALMSSTCLDLINAHDDLLIEGPVAKNDRLCGLIAALRDRPVLVNDSASGVTLGAAALAFYGEAAPPVMARREIAPILGNDIRTYRDLWCRVVDAALNEKRAA